MPSVKYGLLAVFFMPSQLRSAETTRSYCARMIATFFLFVYLGLVFHIVFLSREYGTLDRIDLLPFQTWNAYDMNDTLMYVLENILLFIPIGILLPMGFTIFRSPMRILLACVLLSVFIEILQYCFGTGYLQTDDVINNAIGSLIGYAVWGCVTKWRTG